MAKRLDNNELAFLRALDEVDPQGEYWTAVYASGFDPAKHGADAIADSLEGRFAIAKRLKQRKLVESDGRMTFPHTGVALTEQGNLALEAAGHADG